MRGFEEQESVAKATLDDVLESLQKLNDVVIKLVESLVPAETKTETVTETVEE